MPPLECLPQSTAQIVEQARTTLAVHPGLELSKFVVWDVRHGGGQERLVPHRQEHYKRVAGSLGKLRDLARAWSERRRDGLKCLGDLAHPLIVEAKTPCVLWLAAPTPLELGFCLHHTYGLPYLPGSGLKGLARHAMCRELGCSVEEPAPEVLELFGEGGDKGHAGAVDFLDGIPLKAACLELEVMSPHHPKYYQGESPIPHDCEDPVPLPFLRIAPGSQFEIALVLRDRRAPREHLQRALEYLEKGLQEWGLGAKTSSGYGVFGKQPRHRVRELPSRAKTSSGYGVFGKPSPAPNPGAESLSQQAAQATTASGQPTSVAPVVEAKKFVATIRSWNQETDELELSEEGAGQAIKVSLKQALQRSGLSQGQLANFRNAKQKFEVELRPDGSLGSFLKKKE